MGQYFPNLAIPGPVGHVGCIGAYLGHSRPMLDPWVSSVPIQPHQAYLDMLDVLESIWDTLGPFFPIQPL